MLSADVRSEPGPGLSDGTPRSLFFGEAASPLAGFYHPARVGAVAPVGVVLCYPLGYEQLCSYRACRVLAERLSQSGVPVLRFDYHGTGDSAGSDRQSGRVAAWQESIVAAAAELRRLSGCREICLLGIRIGATLAVSAAAAAGAQGLLLWAPLPTGKAYLREVRAFQRMTSGAGDPPPKASGSHGRPRPDESGPNPGPLSEKDEEVAGFLLSAATVAELSKLDAQAVRLGPGQRVLIIGRDAQPQPAEQRLAERLHATGGDGQGGSAPALDVSYLPLAGYEQMMTEPHRSTAPEEVFVAMLSWLRQRFPASAPVIPSPSDGAPASAPASAWAPLSSATFVDETGTAIREQAIRFGLDDRFFGVVSEPAARPPDPERPTLIFLNPGAVHHIGSNRMYVEMARRLAQQGFRVLRLDLSGLGDSWVAADGNQHHLYSRVTVGDAQAAMERLAISYAARHFVLIGLCSGAYTAFHTAGVDPRVSGLVLLNPQTFTWKEGDSLDIAQKQSSSYKSTRFYVQRLWKARTWERVLRGEVDVAGIVATLSDRLGSRLGARVRGLLGRLRPAGSRGPDSESPIERAFVELLERGCRTFLVFSGEDPGLDNLSLHLPSGLDGLKRYPCFRCEIIDGPDHTFTPRWSQERLSDLITAHLLRG